MKCDKCDKIATVHITDIVGGEKKEVHLCEECANTISETIEMNFGAYNMCRRLGDSVEKCGQELKDDIKSNVVTRQKNIQRELEELKAKVFESEIIL